jgi:hypothetical protein
MPNRLLHNRLLLCAFCVSAVSWVSRAEDWPQWRGPRGDGSSAEADVPTKWSATENVKWKTPLPGKGHGSPVVAGGRVYLNTAIEKEGRRVLLCLDRKDGRVIWRADVLSAPLEKKHGLNSYASSTPLVADGRVFVTFLDIATTSDPGSPPRPNTKTQGRPLIAAYDTDGKPLWRKHLGKFSSIHGWSCSPVPYKENLIVNCDHDGEGYVVCLNRATGEEVWRIDRPNRTRSYCNPTIFEVGGVKHMVMTGSKSTASYDPDTGKERWVVDGPTEQFVAGMVQAQGMFFLTAGFPTHHTMGLTPDGKTVWHQKGTSLAAYVPSPVASGPWLFLVTDENKGAGRGVCFEAKTGEVLWSQPLGDHHRPSAVLAGGNVYWLADDGTCFVVKASDKFELVAKNELGETCNAAPAISDGQVFIRTDKHLWCVGK